MLNWGLLSLAFAGAVWSVPAGKVKEQQPLKLQARVIEELQILGLPPVPESKLGASELMEALAEKNEIEREEWFLSLLMAGHFPDSLRKLQAVHVQARGHRVSFWVMPDYIAIGSDDDSLLVPLNWINSRKLAQAWGFYMPTPRMVDAIYQQAQRVIWPKTYPPGPDMSSLDTIRAHNDWILSQRYLYADQDVLTAGHKKDIVVSRRLYNQPERIAIYGWQNIRDGEPIQPLSLWHGERYADYSHGVRLVAPWVLVDGELMSLAQALNDPQFASALSHEGTLDINRVMRNFEIPALAVNLGAAAP